MRKIAKQFNICCASVKKHASLNMNGSNYKLYDQQDPDFAKSKYLNTGPAYNSSTCVKRGLSPEIIAIIVMCAWRKMKPGGSWAMENSN
jgi:hypothetical protein